MFIRTISCAAAAAALAGSVISAQTRSTAPAQAASTTIVGCVYQEKDVPGRAPNVAERAGIMEDYILAEISPAEAAKPVGTSGSATAPKTFSMYKLEKAADSELKAMVGKRVEVTGKVDAERGDTAGAPPASAQTNKTDKVVGHDRIDLPEFEVASIKAVSGTCPAKPSVDR
jgi:hypothetical protein